MKKSRCLRCVLVCFIVFSVSACGKNQDVQHEQSAVKNETGQAEKELTEKEEVKITSDQKTPVEKNETPIADHATDTSPEIPDTKTNVEDVQKEPDPNVNTEESTEGNTTDTSSEAPDTKTDVEDVKKEPDSSVSTEENTESNTTDTSSEVPDTKTNVEDVQKELDSSVSTEENTEDNTTRGIELDAVESIDEDSYVGEYNSYDTDEPNLEIQKNWDGSYLVQIGMFRLAHLNDCEGKWTAQGLEFSTDEYGKDFSGIITLKDDIATVTFTSEGWKEFADDLNVFKYYKTADVPNIYVPDY